jgi:hypothetical protein
MWTTYHDHDAEARPFRVAQHAAPTFGLSSPARAGAHRALRLFVTVGTWAAGLCLVIGSIVLVSSTSPRTLARIAQAGSRSSGHTGERLAGHRSRLPSPLPAGEIAAFAGRGDETTSQFALKSRAPWQIWWSYSCPAGVPVGQLIVEDAAPGAVGASIDQAGDAGHGETSLTAGPGTHHLVVISNCSWQLKVMQPR